MYCHNNMFEKSSRVHDLRETLWCIYNNSQRVLVMVDRKLHDRRCMLTSVKFNTYLSKYASHYNNRLVEDMFDDLKYACVRKSN